MQSDTAAHSAATVATEAKRRALAVAVARAAEAAVATLSERDAAVAAFEQRAVDAANGNDVATNSDGSCGNDSGAAETIDAAAADVVVFVNAEPTDAKAHDNTAKQSTVATKTSQQQQQQSSKAAANASTLKTVTPSASDATLPSPLNSLSPPQSKSQSKSQSRSLQSSQSLQRSQSLRPQHPRAAPPLLRRPTLRSVARSVASMLSPS